MTLDELKTHCLSCTECELCKTRTQVVFGVGNPAADILLIGEGPGENEDLQGQPFVGRSGKLLDQFLESIDLSREKNVYIANMVKCRPPKNRDPKPEEQEADAALSGILAAITGANPFSDVPGGAYYNAAVRWAVKNGIASGTGRYTFSPNAVCTRAQTVTFLYRGM